MSGKNIDFSDKKIRTPSIKKIKKNKSTFWKSKKYIVLMTLTLIIY